MRHPAERRRRWFRTAVLTVVAATALTVPAASPAAAAPGAVATTSFSVTTGDGRSFAYKAPAHPITLEGGAAELTMAVNDSEGRGIWSATLGAPHWGEVLRPGIYERAEKAGPRSGRAPGLDVIGPDGACGAVFGKFVIDQIETDSEGQVTVLEASFTQRCDSATGPLLKGKLRYRAFPLSFAYTSDPDDPIANGISGKHTGSTTLFSADTGDVPGASASVVVSGDRAWWNIWLAVPTGQQLAVGTYSNARETPDADHPGLNISAFGRVCSTSRGSFTITKLERNEHGGIARLAATFESYCDSREGALRGTIHYYA